VTGGTDALLAAKGEILITHGQGDFFQLNQGPIQIFKNAGERRVDRRHLLSLVQDGLNSFDGRTFHGIEDLFRGMSEIRQFFSVSKNSFLFFQCFFFPDADPSLFKLARVDKGMTDMRGDVRDLDSLCHVLNESRPEIVIHMAAQSLVRDSYEDPVKTYSTNVMGTVNLFEAVRMYKDVKRSST
jgi:hypothetical protein